MKYRIHFSVSLEATVWVSCYQTLETPWAICNSFYLLLPEISPDSQEAFLALCTLFRKNLTFKMSHQSWNSYLSEQDQVKGMEEQAWVSRQLWPQIPVMSLRSWDVLVSDNLNLFLCKKGYHHLCHKGVRRILRSCTSRTSKWKGSLNISFFCPRSSFNRDSDSQSWS